MNRHEKKEGFTILELSIAIMVTVILTMTAGVILTTTYKAINRQADMDDLQGDLRVALPSLYKLARSANNVGATVPVLGATSWIFTVTNSIPNYLSIYRANNLLVADSAGKNLVYERGAGNKMIISSNRVAIFLVSRFTNSISFNLALTNKNDSIQVTNNVSFRN
jgi:type II secretory pathway pseudopilin PulG